MKIYEVIDMMPDIGGAIYDYMHKPPAIVAPSTAPTPKLPTLSPKPSALPTAQSQPVTKSPIAPAQLNVTAKAEPAPFIPDSYKDLLVKTAKKMGITAVNDLSNLLGQAQVETASWTKAAENFNYTDPTRIYKVFTSKFSSPQEAVPYIKNPVALANRALAGKNGNGNEASGDGWRFRGRGFLHITGRELYQQAGAAVHPENPNIYISHPELLSSNPDESAKAAVWYHKTKVGTGKTSKQASLAVNPAGMKSKERAKAVAAQKQQLVAANTKGKKIRKG